MYLEKHFLEKCQIWSQCLNFDFRLILTNSTNSGDPDSRSRVHKNKISLFYKLLTIKASLVLFALGLLLSSPMPASAGFLSFLGDIFGFSGGKPKEVFVENLQNIDLLHAALNSDPVPAKGGGDITIINGSALFSDTGPYGSMADIEESKPESGEISLYVVREGDSLSQIAKMFNVSISTIIWANDIKKGDLIKPGQTLLILPISGVKYVVKEGDTVKGIASKFKGDIDEIIQFNGLSDNSKLVVGSEVIIPNGEDSSYVPASSVKTVTIRGSSGPSYVGYYIRPVEDAIKSQGLHGYNGVDLAAPTGTPVLASASGDVIVSRSTGWNGGYGKYVVVKHPNGTQTLYSHLSEVIVSSGWHVVQGQIIGYVGSTGKSTGPHLHFEVRGAKNPF